MVRVDGRGICDDWSRKKNEAGNERSWKQSESWLSYVISSRVVKEEEMLIISLSVAS